MLQKKLLDLTRRFDSEPTNTEGTPFTIVLPMQASIKDFDYPFKVLSNKFINTLFK